MDGMKHGNAARLGVISVRCAIIHPILAIQRVIVYLDVRKGTKIQI